MLFDFDISPLSLSFFGAALLCMAYVCFVYCRRVLRVKSARAQCDAAAIPAVDAPWPKASVVIYARNESEVLAKNLPAFLRQDYPAPFEVIVVNEGASEETNMVVDALKAVYPNIYLTYTPDGARNLSRKKLALTLGIKAAKGDVVVISEATAEVKSDKWLASLLSDFVVNPSIGVVMGYGAPACPKHGCRGRLTRAFDLAASSVTWLWSAMRARAYRCCGYNLAYRRSIFFDNKGFSRSLNLRNGDDDIFLMEIVKDRPTAVQLASDSMVQNEMVPYMKDTYAYEVSHAFTGRGLPKGSRRALAFGEWCLWLVLGLSVAGAILAGVCNLVGWIACGVLVLAAFVTVGACWHQALRALRTPHWPVSLPFLAMTRPLRNCLINIRSRLKSQSQYTWVK